MKRLLSTFPLLLSLGPILTGCSGSESKPLGEKVTEIPQVAPLPGLKVRPLTDRVFERTAERQSVASISRRAS